MNIFKKGLELIQEHPDKPHGKWINGQYVTTSKNTPAHKAMAEVDADLKKQDAIYNKLIALDEKIQNGLEINEAIQEYEKILTADNLRIINAQKHVLALPNLYIINNQNDKAWAFYNFLYMHSTVDKGKIRGLQAKMLKKDKKHRDAIEFYMLKYMEDFTWKHSFDRAAFIKDIGVSVRALKWTDANQTTIADIMEKYVSSYNHRAMIDEYRAFIQSIEG